MSDNLLAIIDSSIFETGSMIDWFIWISKKLSTFLKHKTTCNTSTWISSKFHRFYRHTFEILGRIFFIDHNERTTSWVDPRTGRASPMPNQVQTPVINKRPEDDLGPLPEGWEERVHSDGRIFFIDHSKYDICENYTSWLILFFFRYQNYSVGRS